MNNPPHLRPFFSLYGSKWRDAIYYPSPKHSTIIEPFAGSAGYSLRHYKHDVMLFEKDPTIAATWRYLIEVSFEEVMALPTTIQGNVDDLHIPCEARTLIGWWLGRTSMSPRKSASAWMRTGKYPKSFWGYSVKQRIAEQVKHIRHWIIIEGDYTDAPSEWEATWFVDPPYSRQGKYYRYGSRGLDYSHLAQWCLELRDQVIVCENVGAEWLPFCPWRSIRANRSQGREQVSHEAIWIR